jgi:AcrR family transcriptional regulator
MMPERSSPISAWTWWVVITPLSIARRNSNAPAEVGPARAAARDATTTKRSRIVSASTSPSPEAFQPTTLTWVPGRQPCPADDGAIAVGSRPHNVRGPYALLDGRRGLHPRTELGEVIDQARDLGRVSTRHSDPLQPQLACEQGHVGVSLDTGAGTQAVLASRRASRRVASAESAAVRMAVMEVLRGARIEDIAAAAGVAIPTIYKRFTNKRKLLAAVVEPAMSGDVDAPVAEQPWWREQIHEPSAARQLRLIARNARQIYDRAGPLLELLRSAAMADPEVEAVARNLEEERHRRSRVSARALVDKGALRPGISAAGAARTHQQVEQGGASPVLVRLDQLARTPSADLRDRHQPHWQHDQPRWSRRARPTRSSALSHRQEDLKEGLRELKVECEKFHGEWNYVI